MLFFSEVLFKPANFKALRSSTTEKHQGLVFGLFEFGRGVLAFLISLFWAALLYFRIEPKTMMIVSCAVIIITGIFVYILLPKEDNNSNEEILVDNSLEAIKGIWSVAKLPVVWVVGLNVFCIYGTFVAAGTYFARFLQAGYGTSAVAASIFASIVIGLRMLPLASSILVEKVFKSTAHFMRTFQIVLVILLSIIALIFFTNHPDINLYIQGYLPNEAPAGLISPIMFYTLMIFMLLASACCFMIRGVYYSPIGELGVSKKHSSAAMSFAITLGYLPALLTPIILGGLVTSPEKDAQGHIIRAFLTDTHTLGWAFVGLAILTLVSVIMSTILIMLKKMLNSDNN